jgi:hypothetical protein
VSDVPNLDILKDFEPRSVVARALGVTERTLRAQDQKGIGLPGKVKQGRTVLYHIPTIRQGLEKKIQKQVRG